MKVASPVSWILRCAIWLALLSVGLLHAQAPDGGQTLRLSAGWNLISIQVGGPLTPAQFSAALSHPERLQQIWEYNPTGNPFTPGQWNTFQPLAPPEFPSDVTKIVPGKGYWVRVSQATDLLLSGPAWSGAVALVPGWNLVGFPGLNLSADESQDLASVFDTHLSKVQQIWTHENDTKRFRGHDPTAIPALRDLTDIRPGMGYWIYATEAFTAEPGPYVILPGDADASPLEPEVDFVPAQFPALPNPQDYLGTQIRKVRPGSEDIPFDLNGNGIIDSILTQSHLKFDIGVDRKVITIGNRGTGLANWVLANDLPWLFTAPGDDRKWPNNAGRPKTASGVVSADRDAVTLHVDTAALPPGLTSGDITVYAGGMVKTITVLIEVPTAGGDWRGLATTRRVNGRDIPIGAVDLGINLFMDSDSPTEKSFRAVLNRDTSLLFPRDVFMNGVFYSGEQFSLTTNFEMPPGDRNAPPFDTFQQPAGYNDLTGAQRARADFDQNNDRKLDVSNPFPFPVRRQITLLGQRKSPDFCEGTYIESITGVLPDSQPILIEGTFTLDRQNFAPTKRSIFNQPSIHAPILIGGTSGSLFRESTIQVNGAVNVQGVSLTLGLDFPDPTKLTILLIGPGGKTVVLHQGGSTLPTSLDLTEFNGLSGQGPWKIRVSWSATPERGYFNSWRIDIKGLATYAVAGKVVGDRNGDGANEALAGAQLVLSGSNVIRQLQTGADGSFNFPGLTENTYSLAIASPGFQDRRISFFLNNANLYLHHGSAQDRERNGGGASTSPAVLASDPILLDPLEIDGPELRASPWIGQEDLFVRFAVLLPRDQLDQIGGSIISSTWDFGDGSDPVVSTASPDDPVNDSAAAHTFTSAGTFTVGVTVTGPFGSLPPLSRTVHVHRATPDTRPGAGDHQLLASGFVGAFAAPLANANVIELAPGHGSTTQQILARGADGALAPVLLSSVSRGTVWQESKRDSASFDIDRPPLIAATDASDFHPAAEDSDFTGQLYVSGDGTATFPFTFRPFDPGDDPPGDNSPGTFAEYHPPTYNNQPVPDRFRCFITLGGAVFANRPLQSGGFVLQTGRVEP
jgi:subtilisin-like proprotein convertase family protein